MEKKEFAAVVAIAFAVVLASKKIQQMKLPSPILAPALAPLQVEALPQGPSIRVAHRLQKPKGTLLAESSSAPSHSADLPDSPAPELAMPGIPPSTQEQELARRINLFDLDMMLKSQVLVEATVDKTTLAPPIFYIVSEPTDFSLTRVDSLVDAGDNAFLIAPKSI